MSLFKRKKYQSALPHDFLTDDRLNSVAVIMDGNGRWAKKRGLPRPKGHIAGAKRVQPMLELFRKIGIHYATLYAFSTENWKRPQEEVDTIMDLAYDYIDRVVIPMIKKDPDFCVKFIGDKAPLSEKLRNKCLEAENMASGRSFLCNIALNYGGRDEICHAVNSAIRDGHQSFTNELISSYLYTKETPEPDLIIRTGGDFRVSNFLIWQGAYSEYVVMDTLFPDFDEDAIMYAVSEFYKRNRRFGGLSNEDSNLEKK